MLRSPTVPSGAGKPGRRAPINDVWIAATAIRHSMSVVTQDSDYDGIAGLEVVRI